MSVAAVILAYLPWIPIAYNQFKTGEQGILDTCNQYGYCCWLYIFCILPYFGT